MVLLLSICGAILLVWSVGRGRHLHTLVASLSTASRTQTSEPEQPYTLAPLRFASETIAPLRQEKTEEFQLKSLTENFDNTENVCAAIEGIIDRLQRDDALVLWIRAKGVSLGGKAYLLGGNYELPASDQEIDNPKGAVLFASLVQAVEAWSGPSLIILDWGSQLADARAGVLENEFLPLAVADISAAEAQVYCLVSHLPGEMSLDDISQRQTLFGRACAEAMVGPRRSPADYQAEVAAEDNLLIGDLAEYVIRRVQADSFGLQTPWLTKGGIGWVPGTRTRWDELTDVPILKLGDNRRPWRWPDLEATADEASLGAEVAGADETPEAEVTPVELTEENWPTGTLWSALDPWYEPSDKLGGWSTAALAPLTARRLATMALDLEMRWFAGDDFRGGSSASDLLSRIKALRLDIGEQAKAIETASRTGPFSVVFEPRPAEVLESHFTTWRRQVDAAAAYRSLAVSLTDLVNLSDNLSRIEPLNVPGGLGQTARQAIHAAGEFLTARAHSGGGVGTSNAAALDKQLRTARGDVLAQVGLLVDSVVANPSSHRPMADLLLRYCWLTHRERRELLQAILTAETSGQSAPWPPKELSQMQPPNPQLKRGAKSLWSDLIRTAQVSTATGTGRQELAAKDIVATLSGAAGLLRKAGRVSDASWLIVDARDLCQKENGWPTVDQQPSLPPQPAPPPQWRLTWENPVGGRLAGERLELDSSSEPASVDLTLTRIGAAEDIEWIQIQFSGLVMRVRGEAASWQRGTLRLTRSDLLRVANLQADAKSLPLEFKALGRDASPTPSIHVRVQAGAASLPREQLLCRLPVARPVELAIEQLICRNGRTTWEPCDQRGSMFTVRPFPGRKTRFRFTASSRDNRARTATIELYRLPPRGRTQAKGRIAESGGAIPVQLEQRSLSTLPRIAVSKTMVLEPKQSGVVVDFSGAAPDSSAGADGEPQSGAGDAVVADVTWGLMAVVRLESEPTRAWRSWVQVVPIAASDFLFAESRLAGDSRTIKFVVGLKDDDGDNIPDLTPTEFSAEQPIQIRCEVGSGVDLKQATLPPMRRVLSPDKPRELLSISTGARIEDEVELWVHVDGAPRALFEFVDVGGRSTRRAPPDRLKLMRVGVAEGLTYLGQFKQNLAENERQLDGFGAVFRRPVQNDIEILLAVDSQSLGRSGEPGAIEFRLVGDNWEHDFGRFYGDRDLSAAIVGNLGQEMTLTCQLSDWRFAFDPSASGDLEASFEGSIGGGNRQPIGTKLVLDGRGPTQLAKASVTSVFEGHTSRLSFSVSDRSPIHQAKITVSPAGQSSQAQQIGEELTGQDFNRIADGWQLRAQTLPIQKLLAGDYEVRVEISDIVGNQSILGPWPLTVKKSASPGGTDQLKGPLKGKLYFGTTTSKPPNQVQVVLKELPDKSTSSGDGQFTIADVEAGSYTVEATTMFQGVQYRGEKKVVLKKREDWLKPILISLKKE